MDASVSYDLGETRSERLLREMREYDAYLELLAAAALLEMGRRLNRGNPGYLCAAASDLFSFSAKMRFHTDDANL